MISSKHDAGVFLISRSEDVTGLLSAWRAGDQQAGNDLVVKMYGELRRLAAHYLKDEGTDHTLQPTALVHELYLKLFSTSPADIQSRAHFLAIAARQLRHIVVDYARAQHAQKRGGAGEKISLDEAQGMAVTVDNRMIELDQALQRLEQLDARAASVVELRFFGGLTEKETGEVLSIAPATVKRDWEFARSWLLNQIA